MLKYLATIVRKRQKFPIAAVWLHQNKSFHQKFACSRTPVDWSMTDVELFHQSYVSSNLLQPSSFD